MKNKAIYFLIAAFMFVCVFSHAQVKFVEFNNPPVDTMTNTDTTIHAVSKVGFYNMVRVTYSLEKVSGTVGGTALLQGSGEDGTWFDIDTVLTFTNQAKQSRTFIVNPHSYRNYRVRWYTSGTQKSIPRTQMYFIRP